MRYRHVVGKRITLPLYYITRLTSLLASLFRTHMYPSFLQEKRVHNFDWTDVSNAIPWSISWKEIGHLDKKAKKKREKRKRMRSNIPIACMRPPSLNAIQLDSGTNRRLTAHCRSTSSFFSSSRRSIEYIVHTSHRLSLSLSPSHSLRRNHP